MSPTGPGIQPTSPRVPMLRVDELDDEQLRLLAPFLDQFDVVPNVLLTVVRHPALFEAWLPLATLLLNGSSFTPRQRELVIMRTAVTVGSHYEWGQHVAMSQGVLDDHDRERIVAGPSAPGWTPLEAALLAAVDQLHARAGIDDATWAQLAAELDERQLIELPMLVGHYHMLAFAVHAIGVQPEPGSPPIP
jgi:4-carboxymuconolactone decarboxylase